MLKALSFQYHFEYSFPTSPTLMVTADAHCYHISLSPSPFKTEKQEPNPDLPSTFASALLESNRAMELANSDFPTIAPKLTPNQQRHHPACVDTKFSNPILQFLV
eukprot:scaffold4133_cov146-Amphora_coffeaeformis.AAC.8